MMGGETGAADPEASLEQGMAAGVQELLMELCPTQRRFSLQRGDYFLLPPSDDKKNKKLLWREWGMG